jgi:F-type H+-transporting ATPase subunit b
MFRSYFAVMRRYNMVRFSIVALIMAMLIVNSPSAMAAPLAADSAPAAAEGDAGHAETPGLLSINPGAAIWNLLIFLLVLFVLGMFVWPPILTGLQAREGKIRADLHGAEQANLQAQATLASYQKQLGDAQSKVQEMLAEARRDAEAVGAKIVEEAKADAERQRARSLADIESAKVAAVTELANQTSDLAMSLARQVVGRELNASDHAELIRQSLERLPSSN